MFCSYTAQSGQRHVAVPTKIIDADGGIANLQVFADPSSGLRDNLIRNVPYNEEGGPNTWGPGPGMTLQDYVAFFTGEPLQQKQDTTLQQATLAGTAGGQQKQQAAGQGG